MQIKTIIAVFGGDIWNNAGVWQTNDLDGPGDRAGATFDRIRIPAAAALLKRYPGAIIVVHGGCAEGDKPSIASVMARELKEDSVPAESIRLEEASESTYQQLLELQKIAEADEPGLILIVSNDYHVGRIEAMLGHAPGLDELHNKKPQVLGAETTVLKAGSSSWIKKIRDFQSSPGYQGRLEKEEQGIGDIRAGRYTYRA